MMTRLDLRKLSAYARLMRLDKPIGTFLLLWPTLWALWIAAGGVPPLYVLIIFTLGTFLMRSAGCVINDYADRHFDGYVSRTRLRPIPAGEVSPREALILAGLLFLTALLIASPLNTLARLLTIPAVLIAASYPFTKRFFAIPQAYLGIAFGFGIPMGFAAISGEIPPIAWMILLANIFWTIAYDTEYAIVDRQDDLKIGIKTSAITFGHFDVPIIMFCYGTMLFLLGLVGILAKRGFSFYTGLFLGCCIALYHYTLIRERTPEKCFRAFRHNNWLGAVVFLGLALDYA